MTCLVLLWVVNGNFWALAAVPVLALLQRPWWTVKLHRAQWVFARPQAAECWCLNRGSSTGYRRTPPRREAYPNCALDLRSSASASHMPAPVGPVGGGRWPPVRRGWPRRARGAHQVAPVPSCRARHPSRAGWPEAVGDKPPA
jgi:hypothetical protein